MRSPKDMGIIEIDITNACVHSCSNCTRFCGHHKKPYFMDVEYFKKAVDSLDGFEGQIGIMGGEPTLHPQFDDIANYIQSKRGGKTALLAKGPISDMQLHIDSMVNYRPTAKAVLLSSLNNGYYEHFEIINDTFEHQLLNDHGSESMHQALLMSRKELGIADEEWIELRDKCWIQNTWSASITPKGAFFCEVAGALDMLFHGPGGWEIESGWWKRGPEDFGEQMKWCELCSACLDAPKRLSHDERDDVSPELYRKLLEVESPKVKKNKVVVRDISKFNEYKTDSYKSGSEYIEAGDEIRFSSDNTNLYPRNIVKLEWKNKVEIDLNNSQDWILITDIENKELEAFLGKKIWNPGCLYIIDNEAYFFNRRAMAFKDTQRVFIDNKYLESLYPEEKQVYVECNDRLLPILGGETRLQRRSFTRNGKKLLVLGAGIIGKKVVHRLLEQDVRDFEVVVTVEPSKEKIEGYEVKRISDFIDIKDSVVVLLATTSQLHEELISVISNYGFKNWITLA